MDITVTDLMTYWPIANTVGWVFAAYFGFVGRRAIGKLDAMTAGILQLQATVAGINTTTAVTSSQLLSHQASDDQQFRGVREDMSGRFQDLNSRLDAQRASIETIRARG